MTSKSNINITKTDELIFRDLNNSDQCGKIPIQNIDYIHHSDQMYIDYTKLICKKSCVDCNLYKKYEHLK